MGSSLIRTLLVISLTSSPFLSEAQTGGDLAITPLPLSKTYPAGTPSPIPGAPPLPAVSIDLNQYPTLDRIPPTDSPVVKAWLSKIDMTKVAAIKPYGLDGCSNATNADAAAKSGPEGHCWWTCGACTRPTDVTTCPSKGTLGASFDDGPSEYTPNVLKYLDQNNLKVTFFIVASRAVSSPHILRAAYMAGHDMCIHTWSHPALTTITNEQIVAEIAWSLKAFKDIIGIEPNCFRAPYSDVNDRVRDILKAMGLKLILWTHTPTDNFDTNGELTTIAGSDWRVVDGSATAASSIQAYQKFLNIQSSLTTGIIVLTHDLFGQTVALSLKYFLPAALKTPGLKIQSIRDCLGQAPSATYFETAGATAPSGTKNPVGPVAPAGNSSLGTAGTAKQGSIATTSVPTNPGSSEKSAKESGASPKESGASPKESGASRAQLSLWGFALCLTIILVLA